MKRAAGPWDTPAIAVTGLGVISAAGDSPAALWERVTAGISPAAWFHAPDSAEGPPVPACAIPGSLAASGEVRHKEKMDRSVQLALYAAGQAFADARLNTESPPHRGLGVVVGTSRGPVQRITDMVDLARQGPHRLPPSLAAHSTLASVSGALSQAFGAQGPCLTVSATCASAGHAIALAAQQLVLGTADVMLAGGTEAPLQDVLIRQLVSTGILGSHADPRRACRPFDATRNGTLLGEGSAFLILESPAAARRRGAPIHAYLAGWATGADCYHYTAPSEDGDGLFQVMTRALDLAGLPADAIDYINAHGTGTRLNDRLEVLALGRLLGARLGQVPCSSTKPITGHCLGAASALEAVISVVALEHQCIPPTANCTELDPDCPIDVVPASCRPAPLRVIMSNSLGFWGNNASLLFTHPLGGPCHGGAELD